MSVVKTPEGYNGLTCELFADGPASASLRLPGDRITVNVCNNCARILRDSAIDVIVETLAGGHAIPGDGGKIEIYEPLNIDDRRVDIFAEIRTDSDARFAIMRKVSQDYFGDIGNDKYSHFDVGCNTGYICQRMAEIGFNSTGIDYSRKVIKVAILAEYYIHKRNTKFIQAESTKYLIDVLETYDVISALSVFQWMYLNQPADLVHRALQICFEKSRRLFFFDVPYKNSDFYKGKLPEPIDANWCMDQLNTGKFDEILVFRGSEYGLNRDMYVGVRNR